MPMKRGPRVAKAAVPAKAPIQIRTPGAMAGPLKQLLEERHLSARGLSLKCGLASDTVRNLLSGRAHSPRGEVAQALADELGVTVAQLYGRESLPQPMMVASGEHIKEVSYAFDKAALPAKATALRREAVESWMVPPDLLADRRLDAGSLVVIRAPEDGDGFRRGDRVLVDEGDKSGSPPGIHLLWDGFAVRAARCEAVRSGKGTVLRMEGRGGVPDERRIGDEIEVLGRVLARWEWL